jgi:phosphatidylethanolamine-binding protein (PEBP) family uncharacterized protein
MQKRVGIALFSAFAVLAVGAGNWACSSSGKQVSGTGGESGEGGGGDSGSGGSGGSSGSGGKGGDSGKGGSGGTGGDSGSGGTGGSAGTGGTGTGGDTGGSGGTGGDTGGSGGTGGDTGGSGGTGGAEADGGVDSGAGGTGGTDTGALKFDLLGLNPVGYKNWKAPTFPKPMCNGGGNHSPAMQWSGAVPAGTMSWAITMIDTNVTVTAGQPVVPNDHVKVHFSFYDIPLATRALKADLPHTATIPDPAGMKASRNFNANEYGWFGPGAGGDPHIYKISLWPINVAKLTTDGSQMGTYTAITKAAVGKPVDFIAVGTINGL